MVGVTVGRHLFPTMGHREEGDKKVFYRVDKGYRKNVSWEEA